MAQVVVLSALGLIPAQGASAAVKCDYNSGNHLLSVVVKIRPSQTAEIRRAGDRIEVTRDKGTRVGCGGSPSVTNTDRIKLVTKNLSAVDISLAGGPLAPGATPEPASSSEIEITINGEGFVSLVGGPGPDHFRYTAIRGQTAVNADPGPEDDDADVILNPSFLSLFFSVIGGGGADRVDVPDDLVGVLGRVDWQVNAYGGADDDTLIGGPGGIFGGARLDGGPGDDLLLGGAMGDSIYPGPGTDSVKAFGGPDKVIMRPDGRRDRINCGSGLDRVQDPNGFDRLRSCERIKDERRK